MPAVQHTTTPESERQEVLRLVQSARQQISTAARELSLATVHARDAGLSTPGASIVLDATREQMDLAAACLTEEIDDILGLMATSGPEATS